MTQIDVSSYFLHASGPVVDVPGGVFGLLLAYATYFPNRVSSARPILPGLLPGWHPRP